MDNRRRHQRYKTSQPITAVMHLGAQSRLVIVSVLNISREGMLIAGELEAYDLSTGSTVNLDLYSSEPREVIAKCQVKVIDFRGEGRFGLHIERISTAELERMMSFATPKPDCQKKR